MKHKKGFPAYFLDKFNLLTGVTISVLFAIVFLVVYSPYSNTAWFETGASERFFLTAFFVVIGTCFLILSRVVMYLLSRRIISFNLLKYILWLLFEIVVIGAFHTLITWKYIHPQGFSFYYLFLKSILITFLALGFPYIVTDLCFVVANMRRVLQVTNTENVESDGEALVPNMEIINLTDNNGSLKLSIKLDNIYYIKSEDNYIKVFYTKNGQLHTYMLRCKIQTIENTFAGSPLIRCHRTYIVNSRKVKVLRNESDGFYMDFDCEGIDSVPVSKTYSDNVVKYFSGH